MTHYILKHGKLGLMRLSLSCFVAVSVVSPITAIAQNADQGSQIEMCRTTTDPAQRLQCYDAIFTTTLPGTTLEPKAKVAVPDPVVIATENFGQRTNTNDLVRPVEKPVKKRKVAKVKPPKVTSISEEVSKIDTFGYKKLRITLANGQVWEQVGSVTQRTPKLSKKRPLIAEIREAALGSFSLQFDGKGRAIKVRRVR